jgi:hypothetical protein
VSSAGVTNLFLRADEACGRSRRQAEGLAAGPGGRPAWRARGAASAGAGPRRTRWRAGQGPRCAAPGPAREGPAGRARPRPPWIRRPRRRCVGGWRRRRGHRRGGRARPGPAARTLRCERCPGAPRVGGRPGTAPGCRGAPRHRVAQLDRVGATGPVLGHDGHAQQALEQGTILDPPLIHRPGVLAVDQGRPQPGDDPLLKMAQARLEQAPALLGEDHLGRRSRPWSSSSCLPVAPRLARRSERPPLRRPPGRRRRRRLGRGG